MAYPKIEGERLDIVLQKLRDKGEATALDGAEEFEALLNRPGRTAAHGSAEAQLLDYIMPLIKDGNIFQGSNPIGLFDQLLDIISSWDVNPEVKNRAMNAVMDERARHYDLLERRNSVISV